MNLFHGRIDGEGIQVGNDTLNHDKSQTISQGAFVLAFARPHELDILTTEEESEGVKATIDRILSFGLNSRIELSAEVALEDGNKQHFYEVELPRAEVLKRGLSEGQQVRIAPSQLRVFEIRSIKNDQITMNFQQLRIIRETAQRNFNLTEVGECTGHLTIRC